MTMPALIKKKSQPGPGLDEAPVTSLGINDVLIQALQTGTFGTVLHSNKCAYWANKTIRVPSTGAGPIGIMAAAVVRHAGARHVVITDVNPYRLELARRMGVTLALDARTQRVADAQKQLGMKEGFDVGLEMSGNSAAFREM